MGKQADNVRVLDDVDITLSLSLEDRAARQYTNISLDVKPIVVRISYRDIKLIMNIVNDAIARLPKQTQAPKGRAPNEAENQSLVNSRLQKPQTVGRRSLQTTSSRTRMQEASVVVSTEKVSQSPNVCMDDELITFSPAFM